MAVKTRYFRGRVEAVAELPEWLTNVIEILVWLLPLGLWVVWWLLAVNWKKAWAVLAEGAWLAVLLLIFLSSLVWSHIDQSKLTITGVGTVSSLWWRIGCVCALTLIALFCGWLQGALGLTPPEMELEPAEAHDNKNGLGVEYGGGHH
jgi:hypothetical protein